MTGRPGEAARTCAKMQPLRVTRASSSRFALFQAGVTDRKLAGLSLICGTYQPEAVAVQRLFTLLGLEALVDERVRRSCDERVETDGRTEVGGEAAHEPMVPSRASQRQGSRSLQEGGEHQICEIPTKLQCVCNYLYARCHQYVIASYSSWTGANRPLGGAWVLPRSRCSTPTPWSVPMLRCDRALRWYCISLFGSHFMGRVVVLIFSLGAARATGLREANPELQSLYPRVG